MIKIERTLLKVQQELADLKAKQQVGGGTTNNNYYNSSASSNNTTYQQQKLSRPNTSNWFYNELIFFTY